MKPRTRKAMIAYLSRHFRYDTMSSGNWATSYAVNIKAQNVPLPAGIDRECVYQMLDVQDAWDKSGFNAILREFDARHFHCFQIGTNGRSGGYLVLYRGGTRASEHKSQCRTCGQANFQAVETEPGVCERCHATARYNRDFPPVVYTLPGQGLDEDGDFSEYDTSSLRSKVDVVWDFDQTCARAVDAYVRFAADNRAVEVEVPCTRKVIVAQAR
jgi:hypothetical protein